jgi:hypothetical protein
MHFAIPIVEASGFKKRAKILSTQQTGRAARA